MMKDSSSFCQSPSLFGLITFFLSFPIHISESVTFKVIGPSHPIMAFMGEDAMLPCHLSPRMSAENMQVRWFRFDFTSLVHLYHNGIDQNAHQMPEYQGRTEFLRDDIANGSVTLRIRDIRPSDKGQYNCLFESRTYNQEALLELEVAGLGSAPLISLEGYQDGGIHVVCRSVGWYPEPEVIWRDPSGRHLPSLSEMKSQAANGLFDTKYSIILQENANPNLSCWIRNPRLNQAKESVIYISDSFFQKGNPWKVSFHVILAILLVAISFILYWLIQKWKHVAEFRKHTAKFRGNVAEFRKDASVFRERNSELRERDAELRKQEAELREHAVEQLGQATELRKWKRDAECWKCNAEFWWKRHAVIIEQANVTLDPDTAHPQLILSESGKSVRWGRGDEQKHLPDNPERFSVNCCVLGCEGFTTGRHYWEVEVQESKHWAVGVITESVGRRESIYFSPEQGIWAVEQRGDGYWACTSPKTFLSFLSLSSHPKRIRVFLDYTEGQVAFFDADTGASIFIFPPACFTGERIHPWFWVWTESPIMLCLRDVE